MMEVLSDIVFLGSGMMEVLSDMVFLGSGMMEVLSDMTEVTHCTNTGGRESR